MNKTHTGEATALSFEQNSGRGVRAIKATAKYQPSLPPEIQCNCSDTYCQLVTTLNQYFVVHRKRLTVSLEKQMLTCRCKQSENQTRQTRQRVDVNLAATLRPGKYKRLTPIRLWLQIADRRDVVYTAWASALHLATGLS